VTSKRDHAVGLARKGFRIFPLIPNGKTPANEGNWRKTASSDPARVAEMWTCPVTEAEQDYNIGIALDRETLVVDVDTRDGKTGDKSLALLEAVYDDLHETLEIETASGATHLYFKSESPVGNSASKVGTHIDIKSEGGFVVGPGSTIDGEAYKIVRDNEIAVANGWLVRLAGAPRERAAATGEPLTELDTHAAIARATEWLTAKAPEAGTFAVAARVKDFGVSQETCLDLLMEHWPPAEAKGEEHVAFRVANAYRYGQNAPGIASAEAEFEAATVKEKLRGGIELEPVTPFDAVDIPKRQWVLGTFAAKHYLSGLVSPPGVGKTTFLLMLAVAIATGRDDIVGMKVHRRGRVLLWNQEDELDELKRRLLAVLEAFDVKWSDLEVDGKPGIVLGSGVDRRLMFAKRNASGQIVPAPDAKAIEDFIRQEGIVAAIFDPFVEMHEANENDNPEVAVVGAVFRRVAVSAGCAVILAHHTRKPPAASASDAYAGNMDTARGAGSLNGVARMVATLYTIDGATGKRYGIKEDECRRYIRFDDAKANMSLVSGEPMFFRREGVTIGGFGGEEVGVLRPVELSRVKDAKVAARDDLVADVIEALGEDESRPITDIAKDIASLPMRADTSVDALAKAIKRTFEKEVKSDKGDSFTLENRRIKGRPGRHVVLLRTRGQRSETVGASEDT